MYNNDLASLVREALIQSGCSEDILSDFDSHSTISLDFNDKPSILISMRDEQVWLWTKLTEYNEYTFESCYKDLFEVMIEPYSHSPTNQINYEVTDGTFELRALISENSLYEPSVFAEALNEFFLKIETIMEKLKL